MLFNSIRIGLFLAIRYIRRSNKWATVLIVFIMLLTFLNVVVVRGILVGLPVGASTAYENQYSGAVFITPLPERKYIEQTKDVEAAVENAPGYLMHSRRLIAQGRVEANYEESRKSSYLPDDVGVSVVGINPDIEHSITKLADRVVEGRYLTLDDNDGVLLGSEILERYAGGPDDVGSIEDVYPEDKVRITIGENQREFTVVGVIKSKVNEVSQRVFMIDTTARNMMERFDGNVDEIAMRISSSVTPESVRDDILAAGAGEFAEVETSRESQGQFLEDIINTFDLLSGMIGLIGLTVASITVFIVIFINAVSRKRQIGILKGIGIHGLGIELSYVFLSMFYAVTGVVLGFLVLEFGLQPYFTNNPIDFPFADGVLVAPFDDTLNRSGFILLATLLAGYIPARVIVRKNTINAILGR